MILRRTLLAAIAVPVCVATACEAPRCPRGRRGVGPAPGPPTSGDSGKLAAQARQLVAEIRQYWRDARAGKKPGRMPWRSRGVNRSMLCST